MSTTKKEVSPLRVLNVSARDREIYQAVKIGGKQQRAVALEYKLSQPRVSAIIKRVTRWLSQGDPPGLGELYRRDRLRAVSRLHRMRLEQLYMETLEAWHKSDEPTHTVEQKVVKGEIVTLKKMQTRQRDGRLERDLHAILHSIVAFEGFDKEGNVDESCSGRIYEEPECSPIDACREVKRRTIAGGFDTPGDEGIPGLWGEEMERRNATLKGRSQNAECRSGEGEAGEALAEPKAERQLGESSLAPVLRGEGRGEGPAPREDEGRSEKAEGRSGGEEEITTEYRANIPPITATIPPILSESKGNNPTQLLSKNQPDSSQVPQQQEITTFTQPAKVLSNNPPKVPRVRLMGTAAQMAECESFEEYYSPERRAARAFERAMAGQQQGNSQGPPLSPEYRGEGGRLRAPILRRTKPSSPHRPNSPSPYPVLRRTKLDR